MMSRPYILIVLLVLQVSCQNFETKNSDVNPSEIYFYYNIKGDEKSNSVTIYIQYKRVGSNGSSIMLHDPAKVQLDG